MIDDASTDASAEKITQLQKNNPFLFLQNEQNLGLQTSLNHALTVVSGEYLGIFASDDAILPKKIEKLVSFIQRHNLDGAYASGYVLYPGGQQVPMDMERVDQMFKDGTYLEHIYVCDTYGAMFQSGLFKASALKNLSYIRKQFWSDDWAVTIKLLENYHIGFLNEPTVIYRVHENNTYKNYWNSFPGRVQVVSLLTPLEVRYRALSNLFRSQAAYLEPDNLPFATKFYFASLAMEFSRENLAKCISVLNIRPQILKRILLRMLIK